VNSLTAEYTPAANATGGVQCGCSVTHGVGVHGTDLESTVRFFAETLGLSLIEQREGLAQFVMPSGQLFEVFGSKSRYYQLHACPVLGFQVEDVRAARRELESAGVEFVTDVFGDESEAWTYFRGPDSYVYELWQTPCPIKRLPPHALKGAGQ
jgi:catechol 2,3-dioxygenase-like lactoylglutathione lyase family enzyme